MAHFAEINEDGIVQRVVVVGNDDLIDENGEESEQVGIAFLQNLFPDSVTTWVQTSYNSSFRVRYAGPGMKYYKDLDAFGDAKAPDNFPSWVLNEQSMFFEPPIPMPRARPNEGYFWYWDEATISWKQSKMPTALSPEPSDITGTVMLGIDKKQ